MLGTPQLDDKINLPIDRPTKTALQVLAGRDQISLSDFVRFAIRFYVEAKYKQEFEEIIKELKNASTST